MSPPRLRVTPPSFAGRIGAAVRDITPPVGIYHRNWGAAATDTAEGVHQPLVAVALCLQADASPRPCYLIALDGCWWKRAEDESLLRQPLLSALDVPAANVMITLTHTHAGPSLCAADADKPGGALIPAYYDALREAVVSVAREAQSQMIEATLSWTYGLCDLAANRDLPDPAPERARLVTGYNPDAPADPTLLVGRATAADGRILATVVNYACHPTTLAWDNHLLSPDFVGALRETVETATGGAPCLFLQGASGELAPALQYVGDVAVAERHGRRLGYAVLSALEGMPAHNRALTFDRVVESGAPLAIWLEKPFEPPRDAEAVLAAASIAIKPDYPPLAAIEAELAACEDRVMSERIKRKRDLRLYIGDAPAMAYPVYAWRLGGAYLIGHPGEAYSRLQIALRALNPHAAIAVANNTNGSTGYFPPAELYDLDLYAVWQTPFERGAFETLLEFCQAQIARLAPRPAR